MPMRKILGRCLLLSIIIACTGCVSIPSEHHDGGFHITAGSGQEYYAHSIDFVGRDEVGTWHVRDWAAEDFNKLGLLYLKNGGGMGTGTLSFISSIDNHPVRLNDAFRVDVMSEEEYRETLHNLITKKNRE